MEIEEINMEELHKAGFRVDFLPKDLKIGAMFNMSGYTFLHLGGKNCVMITFEGEEIDLPFC